MLDPLDGFEMMTGKDDANYGMVHQYYLNVVPTTYADAKGRLYNVHQFTVNENSLMVDSLSALYFRLVIYLYIFF